MDQDAIRWAQERLQAAKERVVDAELDALLIRTRTQLEEIAELSATFQSTLPDRVGSAVREGLRTEAMPVAKNLAEVRGLTSQVIRRLEGVEGKIEAERHARLDDLAVLIELISTGWQDVSDRLRRLEQSLESGGGAIVYRIDERPTRATG